MPSSKYDESIFTVAAMRSYATITVATLYYYYLVTRSSQFYNRGFPTSSGQRVAVKTCTGGFKREGQGSSPPPELDLRQVLGEDVWRL